MVCIKAFKAVAIIFYYKMTQQKYKKLSIYIYMDFQSLS